MAHTLCHSRHDAFRWIGPGSRFYGSVRMRQQPEKLHLPVRGLLERRGGKIRYRYLHSDSVSTSPQSRAAPAVLESRSREAPPVSRRNSTSNTTTSSRSTTSPMSRLSLASLLRSLFLGYCFTSPRVLMVLMWPMNFVAHSKSPFLNPDRNPVLRGIIRAAVYDHFCAGTSPAEVKATIKQIKSAGYAGVILGYGREIVVDTPERGSRQRKGKVLAGAEGKDFAGEEEDKHISLWLQGNLDTLGMIGRDDYMNVKFTGAGPRVSQCLIDGTQPPGQFKKAIDAICHQARSQGSRIWIDAEQQIFQPSIDAWTIDFMRQHNIHGDALIFNTLQTYLKSSRRTLAKQLQIASDEGWTLGIKQVRGAYIASDVRDRIWDTKAETDESYNSIARDLLSKNTMVGVFPGLKPHQFPDLRLFLAGHNTESIRRATAFVRELVMTGKKVPPVQYGQLHGMADDVSCDLVEQYETAIKNLEQHKGEGGAVAAKYELELQAAPVVYKCLNWGSVRECLHFLLRRAVENASAADRIKEGLPDLRAELKRRFLRKA